MRVGGLVALCALLVGCVAPTEVKQASSELTVALSSLRDSQGSFRDAYIRELEDTRQLIARAIVADAVVLKVNQLSDDEMSGNLIAISQAIENERDAYQQLVNTIMQEKIAPDDTPENVVKRVLQREVSALRSTAKELGDTDAAKKLRARADQLENAPTVLGQYDDMIAMVRVEATKNEVRQGLKDLEDYIQFLQLIQATVNDWITTDVNVEGEAVAELIEKHQKLLGLDRSQGGQ